MPCFTPAPLGAPHGLLLNTLHFQVLLESPDAQLADTSGLQLALALGYSVYSLRENKRMNLGGCLDEWKHS